jgi:hypothetical protein
MRRGDMVPFNAARKSRTYIVSTDSIGTEARSPIMRSSDAD